MAASSSKEGSAADSGRCQAKSNKTDDDDDDEFRFKSEEREGRFTRFDGSLKIYYLSVGVHVDHHNLVLLLLLLLLRVAQYSNMRL